MGVYVTRVTVESWPTDDGQPWPRFIPFDDVLNADEKDWLRRTYDDDALEDFIADIDAHTLEPIGYVLPSTGRKHWFSATAAKRWAERARKLGAVVTVKTSKAVEWPAE